MKMPISFDFCKTSKINSKFSNFQRTVYLNPLVRKGIEKRKPLITLAVDLYHDVL